MPDLSSVAREAAERSGLYPETMLGNRQLQRAYALGFTECASRLPSETEIAETIAAGYDSVYTSRLPVNEHDHRAARAVLALIGEKISG